MSRIRLNIAALLIVAAFLVIGANIALSRPTTTGSGAGPATTCGNTSACLTEKNTSTGYAISGDSEMGSAVLGQTKFNSTSQSNGRRGVIGKDLSTSGTFNIGVFGFSSLGTGVGGSTTSGQAVVGAANSGVGVAGYSQTLDGVQGNGARFGVYGISSNGDGVRAESASTNAEALFIVQDGTGHFMRADNSACSCYEMSLDLGGNMILRGTLTQNGNPNIVTRTTTGAQVLAYGTRQSQPTIEDTGEARMVNGSAFVRIDSAFASTMDPHASYTVLITPEGDSNGVFVTAKSLEGFEVRENHNGRSTVSFAYRIVAKPYDTNVPRLPLVRTIPSLTEFNTSVSTNATRPRVLHR